MAAAMISPRRLPIRYMATVACRHVGRRLARGHARLPLFPSQGSRRPQLLRSVLRSEAQQPGAGAERTSPPGPHGVQDGKPRQAWSLDSSPPACPACQAARGCTADRYQGPSGKPSSMTPRGRSGPASNVRRASSSSSPPAFLRRATRAQGRSGTKPKGEWLGTHQPATRPGRARTLDGVLVRLDGPRHTMYPSPNPRRTTAPQASDIPFCS